MDSIQDILTNLLRNLASRREIEQYLRAFTEVDSAKFAVIKVGGGVLRDGPEQLAAALSFLRRVGLFPIVVHGAGPQLDIALEEAGIASETRDGLRVTTPDILRVARRVIQDVNLQLVESLEQMGTRARSIHGGVFEATCIDQDRLGFVGEVQSVATASIEASIRSGQLPIVSCLGETSSGQILNVNADMAAHALSESVQPYKVIFLTPTGGLLDARGHVLPAINLVEDYDRLLSEPWVHGGMALKLRQIKSLLDALPSTSSISITSPEHLARELFTHRGSGTLVRRGDFIQSFEGKELDAVDTNRLKTLLESGFGGSLQHDYFSSRDIRQIYVTANYAAAAVITQVDGRSYLDKFAVTAAAQGEGLGASLWSRVRRDHDRLFWRARPDNAINPWYFRKADGTWRTDAWVVFWYGYEDFGEISTCVDAALSIPPSLVTTQIETKPNEHNTIATGA